MSFLSFRVVETASLRNSHPRKKIYLLTLSQNSKGGESFVSLSVFGVDVSDLEMNNEKVSSGEVWPSL